tara:strand:+ start:62 stop:919 length:858 start_codon:yes stop_codon:yes gene_type:complete
MNKWLTVPLKERRFFFKKLANKRTRQQKTKLFKNMFQGSEAVCFLTGVSLNEFPVDKIQKFCENKVVFAVKTAALKFPNIVDICITNSYNTFHFPKEKNYLVFARQDMPINYKNWVNADLIKKNTYALNFVNEPDILWGSDVSAGHSKSVCNANRWNENSFDNNPDNRIIGPGIMNDMVAPILVHTGVTKVSFLGWDGSRLDQNGNIKHFYDIEESYKPTMNYVTDDFDMNNLKADLPEHEQEIGQRSEIHLTKYLEYNNIDIEILTKNSNINSYVNRNFVLYEE